MAEYNPTLKARYERALSQVLPEPVQISLANSFVIGPFENHNLVGVFTAYPPEQAAAGKLDFQARYPGKRGEVAWQRAAQLDGWIAQPLSWEQSLPPEERSVVYYAAQVTVAEPTAARLNLQASSLAHAWLNGIPLIVPAIPHDSGEAWVTLKPGVNQILVKMMFLDSLDQRLAVQVRGFGPLADALSAIRRVASDQALEAGVRLTARVTRIELLGVAEDEAGVRAALADLRQDAYATRWDVAWADAVERQSERSGHFAPFHDPVMAYQPVTEVQPYPEYWPQSSPTAKDLLVVDVSASSPCEEFALSVLQGLVNRKQPRLYLLHTRYARQDQQWLDELVLEGYTWGAISLEQTWEMFKAELRGAVLYDAAIMDEIGSFHSDQLNQTNVIMMICALEDAVPLTPAMNQALGLPVIDDARGKWASQYEMMHWAYLELFPRMNHRLLATNYPGIFILTDYLVSFKIFTFWFPEYRTVVEENLLRGILASTPPNSPILGWWFDWMPNPKDPSRQHADAVMETPGVLRGSYFGKFLTPSHEAANLTVHSGVPLANERHKTPERPEFDPGKVYYTFMISDGDNMGEALMLRTRDLQWDKPERGQFPMGWSFAPATSRLAPPVLNYYLRTASPNDVLMGGLGVAYTEPVIYLRAFPDQFEALWEEYARATDKALGWIDSTVLWLINGRHEEADRYARGSSGQLRGIFIGYGGAPEIAEARLTHNQVVAFYSATRTHWSDNSPTEARIQAMVDEIRAGVRQRPDFIEAWVLNWGLDMNMLLEVQRRLGPDYICVRTDVLADLRRLAG